MNLQSGGRAPLDGEKGAMRPPSGVWEGPSTIRLSLPTNTFTHASAGFTIEPRPPHCAALTFARSLARGSINAREAAFCILHLWLISYYWSDKPALHCGSRPSLPVLPLEISSNRSSVLVCQCRDAWPTWRIECASFSKPDSPHFHAMPVPQSNENRAAVGWVG